MEGVIHNQITLFGTLTITLMIDDTSPEASRLAAIQFISEIKENVTTSTNTSASVLASASKELPREIISYIPKIDSLKRTIQ